MSKIRLVITEDHSMVREGLKMMLNQSDEIDVVGEASNGLEALQKVKEEKPDILLMDIKMPKMDGIETTKRIKEQSLDVKVIILSVYTEDEYISEAIRSGASGYILKSIAKNELVEVIKKVYAGEAVIDPSLTKILLKEISNQGKPNQKAPDLTNRQIDILLRMSHGATNKEIAQELNLSIETVKTHVKNIYKKLNVSDRAEAVATALRVKIVE